MVIVHDHDGDDDDAGDHADDDDARDDAAQQGQWALMIRIRAVRSPTGGCAQQGAKAAGGVMRIDVQKDVVLQADTLLIHPSCSSLLSIKSSIHPSIGTVAMCLMEWQTMSLACS